MSSRPVAVAAERLRASLCAPAPGTGSRLPVAVLTEVVRRVAAGAPRARLGDGLGIDPATFDGPLAELGTWLAQRSGGAPPDLRPPGFTRTACGRDIARSVAAVAHHAPDELTVARWLTGRAQAPPAIEPGWQLVAGLGALWRSRFGPEWDTAVVGTPVAGVAVALWDEIDQLVADAVTVHRAVVRQPEPPNGDRARFAAALDEVAMRRAFAGGADAWARYRATWPGRYPRGPEDLDVTRLLRLWEHRDCRQAAVVA